MLKNILTAFLLCLMGFGPITAFAGKPHCQVNAFSESLYKNTEDVMKAGSQTTVQKTVSKGSGGGGKLLLLRPGKRGTIKYGELSLGVSCNPISKGIKIVLDLKHEKMTVTSTIIVTDGHEVKVGNVVQNLKEEAKKLGFPEGYFKKKKSGKEEQSLKLKVTTKKL